MQPSTDSPGVRFPPPLLYAGAVIALGEPFSAGCS
jgi:hypothetical protein